MDHRTSTASTETADDYRGAAGTDDPFELVPDDVEKASPVRPEYLTAPQDDGTGASMEPPPEDTEPTSGVNEDMPVYAEA